jgi:hypothetical protein
MLSHGGSICRRLAALLCMASAPLANASRLDVTPEFPAYGQAVSVQLSDIGPPPYLRVTRYQRKGSTIALEVEHVAGGYFGPRRDVGYVPVTIGELAAGHYTIQAKLFDMANPDSPPYLFTRGIDVAPPDSAGVYWVPRVPGAGESFELAVKADTPIDASSIRTTIDGWTMRVDFDYASDRSASTYATVKVAGMKPGSYRVEAFGHAPNAAAPSITYMANLFVNPAATVVEYYSPKLDHYLISAWPDEIAALDADPRAAFQRTGERFKAWPSADSAPAWASPVCRFYASGANSHFYTADPAECQFLKSLEQKQRSDANAKGQSFLGWQFESIAFYAIAPQNGQCPAGTQAVYRAYNNRGAEQDPNHRFTVTAEMRAVMATAWTEEGVAFCAPV